MTKLTQRIPWTALVITLAVLICGAFTIDAIRDAGTHEEITEAVLVRPLGYIAIAPLSDVLDMLTLLSKQQHVALVLGALVLFGAGRGLRAWLVKPNWRSHVVSLATAFVVLLLVYASAALLPRPMARLEASNANILLADFHSHTSASHDVRGGWSAESDRSWHHAAGFDVAYVTDHGSVTGAEVGVAANGPVADGTTLLQGIEVTWAGEHVTILGIERMYKGLLTANKRDVDEQALQLASLLPGREPVVIWNHPHDLGKLPLARGSGAGVRAIEIVNGDPTAIDNIRSTRASIIAAAQKGDLALTAGSDNHGWGHTAPGWTMLYIPGWRGMSVDSLDYIIQKQLREGGFRTTRAVERATEDPAGSPIALAATVVLAPIAMFRSITIDERMAWLIWTWGITIGLTWWRRRSS